MILIHSNVSKFFKKQNFNTLGVVWMRTVTLWMRRHLYLENNEVVTFKISYRPDFQDEYVLMFTGMFLLVVLLFRTIFKWFAFSTYLMWIKIIYRGSIKSEGYMCCRSGPYFANTNFRDINFELDLFSQIAKSRFFACILFAFAKIWL